MGFVSVPRTSSPDTTVSEDVEDFGVCRGHCDHPAVNLERCNGGPRRGCSPKMTLLPVSKRILFILGLQIHGPMYKNLGTTGEIDHLQVATWHNISQTTKPHSFPRH